MKTTEMREGRAARCEDRRGGAWRPRRSLPVLAGADDVLYGGLGS